MKVVVLFQTRTGNTGTAARKIATAFRERDTDVSLYPVTDFDYKALARADLVVIGTWVAGHFIVAQKPAQLARLNEMPDIYGKRAAVFLTYALNPGKAIDAMAEWAESRGATVVARHAFHRRRVDEDVEDFVDAALGAVPATA